MAPQRRDEVRALSTLAFAQLGAATGGIGALHRAIADRTVASPPRRAHDAIAGGVYRAVAEGLRVAGAGVDRLLAVRSRGDGLQPSDSPRGAAALAVLTGLIGDDLEAQRSDLHQPMTVRVGGRAVAIEPGAVAPAFPRATPRLVVFVHGLMETEHAWQRSDADSYGTRLRRDAGLTPVYVRANTGRPIADNGRELATLIAELAAAWPVAVAEIAFVGHSMGALIAHSACHQAARDGAAWAARVHRIVSLGAPHRGAPLARAVDAAGDVLALMPETRPLSGLLRRRSAGIGDLRHGLVPGEDAHPAATRFVVATVSRDPGHPVGRAIGDLLVLPDSASARGGDGIHVGGAHHFALLNHPAVYERLREWLSEPPVSGRRP
jgi:hypothetical protein